MIFTLTLYDIVIKSNIRLIISKQSLCMIDEHYFKKVGNPTTIIPWPFQHMYGLNN
jgi:hypothetical protein